MFKVVRCEWGVVKIVYTDGNVVYVIHDPAFHDTGVRVAEELAEQGYNVVRLNTGVDYEREIADKLLDFCDSM